MNPFADFTYFGLLLYVAIPAILLGMFGRANARWALVATLAFLGLVAAWIASGTFALRQAVALPLVEPLVAGFLTLTIRIRKKPSANRL